MQTRAFLVHALTPLHAGTGQAQDLIDLPIARMKGTNLPFVPGSSIKGVLRGACEVASDWTDQQVFAAFGPPKSDAAAHAGALVVGDARLLALPVRSFRGTFAWVTSPLLMELAKRDLQWTLNVPTLNSASAMHVTGSVNQHQGKIYLEDVDLRATESADAKGWAVKLANLLYPNAPTVFTNRFVVVDDDTLTFLSETATQVDARVSIDRDTRTVKEGALWLEESLPAETVLVGLMASDKSRRKDHSMSGTEILDKLLSTERAEQLGGKASVGRGRCRVLPVEVPRA